MALASSALPTSQVADARRSGLATTVTLACLGVFCAYLQISAVSVSLATIGRDLHVTTSALQWMFDAFTIPVAALVLTFGVVGDLAGRKRVTIAGLALTVGGNLVSLLAPNITVLLVGRAVAGVGAAALLPTTLALIAHAVPEPARRGRYVALWTAALNIGLALGPFIAGTLLTHASWRWIFLPMALVPLVVLILSARLLEDSRAHEDRRLDLPGQALAALGIVALIYGVVEGGHQGWTSVHALAALPTAAVALAAFGLVERRSRAPMLSPRLLATPAFLAAVLAGLLAMFSLIGSNFVLSLFLGTVQGLSPLSIATRLLYLYGAVLVTGQLTGRALARTGPRLPLTGGLLLASVGLFTLRGIQPDTSMLDLGWRLALLGLGFGLVLTSVTAAAVNAVPRPLAGMASAAINAFRQVGSALGPAVLGVVLTTATVSHLVDAKSPGTTPGTVHTLASEGLGGLPHLAVSDAGRNVIAHSAASALHVCATVSSAGMLLAAILAAILLPRGNQDATR